MAFGRAADGSAEDAAGGGGGEKPGGGGEGEGGEGEDDEDCGGAYGGEDVRAMSPLALFVGESRFEIRWSRRCIVGIGPGQEIVLCQKSGPRVTAWKTGEHREHYRREEIWSQHRRQL